MSAPPGMTPATPNRITGTGTNAETKRRGSGSTKKVVASKVIRAMNAAGLPPCGWQVRSLTATLIANREAPTNEDVVRALMAAPWYPKPRRRQWRVGEGGGWAVRS